jgi:excisionase family DNA binding protein
MEAGGAMAIEDTLEAILKANHQTNRLLQQLLAANAGDIKRVKDAAKHLGLSAEHIRRRIQDGKYTPYRDGRVICVSLSEIRQKMEAEGK